MPKERTGKSSAGASSQVCHWDPHPGTKIGGAGSITGSYMGAAFIWIFPIVLKELGKGLFGIDATVMENVSLVAIGAMIVIILIKEPHGLARLWQIGKQKLRLWPFPH